MNKNEKETKREGDKRRRRGKKKKGVAIKNLLLFSVLLKNNQTVAVVLPEASDLVVLKKERGRLSVLLHCHTSKFHKKRKKKEE